MTFSKRVGGAGHKRGELATHFAGRATHFVKKDEHFVRKGNTLEEEYLESHRI